MSTQTNRTMSESDEAMLKAYLRLPPEDREKVIAYAARLQAARYNPKPSSAPHP